jgi:hypothetical protein
MIHPTDWSWIQWLIRERGHTEQEAMDRYIEVKNMKARFDLAKYLLSDEGEKRIMRAALRR